MVMRCWTPHCSWCSKQRHSVGPRFVPAVLVLGILGFAGSAASMAFATDYPRLWSAAVGLLVLSGITPLIYAVNMRVVPVFSRRDWRFPRWLQAGIACGLAGGWLVFLGRASGNETLELLGQVAAWVGGVSFAANIVLLFRAPVSARGAPPMPFPEQAAFDRVGTQFTRMAGIWLVVGLTIGVLLQVWTPYRGRWDLVWAHAMLLGWFLMMASGIAYHVLSRWTGERWRSLRRARLHFVLAACGVPVMVLALALDYTRLFAVAGTLLAATVLLFLWNILPLVLRLPQISRTAVVAAGTFLALGVLLGASVAVDPQNHTRLRFSHAQINLLGWAGLLVCGMGYYLFPRFAGQPLRWPRLARAQIVLHIVAVVLSAGAWWWYLAVGRGAETLITVGSLLVAVSFTTFSALIALTFQRSGRVVTQMINVQPRRPAAPRG